MIKPVFLTNFFEQRRTINSLVAESSANQSFYFFLSVAALLTTLGFLIEDTLVVVGGMLVAPLLFPILSLGMGIATSSAEAIKRASGIILKSIGVVFGISFLTAFIFAPEGVVTEQMTSLGTPDFLFFLAAFAAGSVAAYAWVKENIAATLPGIAVTLTLVPPLTLAGIALSLLSRPLLSGSIMLFLINLLGIVVGSTVIFSLFGFSGLQEVEEERIKEEELEEKVRQQAREEAKEKE